MSVKDLADLVTAAAAFVAAVQSWRAKGDTDKIRETIGQIITKQNTTVIVNNNPTQTVGAAVTPPSLPET